MECKFKQKNAIYGFWGTRERGTANSEKKVVITLKNFTLDLATAIGQFQNIGGIYR